MTPALWKSGDLPNYHYLRFTDETEEQRIERLIELVSKWVTRADGGIWQKELNRLKSQLQVLQSSYN